MARKFQHLINNIAIVLVITSPSLYGRAINTQVSRTRQLEVSCSSVGFPKFQRPARLDARLFALSKSFGKISWVSQVNTDDLC